MQLNQTLARVAIASALAAALAACGKPADTSPATATTTDSVLNDIDDTVLTTRVKAALAADPKINNYDFTVETRKGDVLLSGLVDDQAQINLAVRTTRNIEGVKSIHNNVTLISAAAAGGKK